MDFVVQVDRLPVPGETILGWDFENFPGGKGANQANAAGRLSPAGRVRMVGLVGTDTFGDQLKTSLMISRVDVAHVSQDLQPTGIAMIWVDCHTGQNSIVVASGANGELKPSHIDAASDAYQGARCALFQLESPLETVHHALRTAREAGATTMLDPAPARILPDSLLGLVDILTPNESEACLLLGRPAERVSPENAPALARALRKKGPGTVILKLGDRGCYAESEAGGLFAPGFAVEAVDTTAAGDTFNGALAVALAEDMALPGALRFANAAAAISVTRFGAQVSAPSREEVEAFLTQRSAITS